MSVIFLDDGQYQDDYMEYMNSAIMPEIRTLTEAMKRYLDAVGASGLDYLFMMKYIMDELELDSQNAYLTYIEMKTFNEQQEGKS